MWSKSKAFGKEQRGGLKMEIDIQRMIKQLEETHADIVGYKVEFNHKGKSYLLEYSIKHSDQEQEETFDE